MYIISTILYFKILYAQERAQEGVEINPPYAHDLRKEV